MATPDVCPQCTHPVKLNAAKCPSCGRMFHELCLKRGCVCGGKPLAAGGGGGGGGGGARDLPMLGGFALGVVALGAAYAQRGAPVMQSPAFWPAAGIGVVGLLAALGRKVDEDARRGLAHGAAQILLVPAAAALAVAAKGGAFPGVMLAVYAGLAGAVVAVLALLADASRSGAVIALLLAAHCYFASGVLLSPAFVQRSLEQGLAVGQGKSPPSSLLTSMPVAVRAVTAPAAATPPPPAVVPAAPAEAPVAAPAGTASPAPDFKVTGTLSMGGASRAMTSKGAFGVGEEIPGVGRVQSVTDQEVVIGDQHYPVPH